MTFRLLNQTVPQASNDLETFLLGILAATIPTIIALIKVVGPAVGRIAEAWAARREQDVVTKKLLNERLKADEEVRVANRSAFQEIIENRMDKAESRADKAEEAAWKLQERFERNEAAHALKYAEYEGQISVLRKDLVHVNEEFKTQGETLDFEQRARMSLEEKVRLVEEELKMVTLQRDTFRKQLEDLGVVPIEV